MWPGLTEVEATVGALVEIIHAFASCDTESINLTTKLYVRLLLSKVGCAYVFFPQKYSGFLYDLCMFVTHSVLSLCQSLITERMCILVVPYVWMPSFFA